MSQWQLTNNLPKDLHMIDEYDQKRFLTEKYKQCNPLYLMLQEDLNNIKDKDTETIDELKIFNIDPRYLESIGFKEDQIDGFYAFIDKIKNS
jgi:hypothetical protein